MQGRHPPIVESPDAWQAHWPDESATEAFAQRLARGLVHWPGGADAYLELRGSLGAGKTTLVRHLLRALGVSGRIKSPTYAVVEPHEAHPVDGATWPVWHFDFYRFNDPEEWSDAGFRDVFAGPGLKLAEWPEQAGGLLPAADWVIALEAEDESARRVAIRPGTARGADWLARWRAAEGQNEGQDARD